MNSIRWMPMIRWLKFPFRVHILHKTVQLSVHEPRGGYACMCVWKHAQQCHLALESEGGNQFFNIFFCFCISFFYYPWAVKSAFIFVIKVLFEILHLEVVLENMCNQSHCIFYMIRTILIISFSQLVKIRGKFQHVLCIPCQRCSIMPHCERVSNFSLCESESEQGSYSLPDNCQNNSR